MRRKIIFPTLTILLLVPFILNAQETPQHSIKYVPEHKNPVLEEMIENNKTIENEMQEVTDSIRDVQSEAKEKEEQEEREIRFDFTGIQKPGSPDEFKNIFHFKPVSQFLTGTCWSFSTTSYFESEIFKNTGNPAPTPTKKAS